MTQPEPVIRLHKNCTESNADAIRAYWKRRVAARSYAAYIIADWTYLYESGRITEAEFNEMSRVDHPAALAPMQLRSRRARQEDGDQTLWSDPPKWWLGEQ